MSRDSASNQLQQHREQAKTPCTLTASNGAPIDSLTASMTTPSGHILLQDFNLIDHLSHFDRERIPERVVHAKGAGAFGYFEVLDPFLSNICKADMFQMHRKTPVAARFSTFGGESGSSDTARDPRGFAIKFYTSQGNWDMVGNNTPIFFLRDPILFPSFIHTQKRNPVTHLADPDAFWDFISLRPETMHQVAFLFSDRGTPDGYRHMNGYSSHAFKNVNHKGEPVYVKYHFKTDQGIRNLSAEEAAKLAAEDPDYAIRDLYNAIANGNYPSWTLYVQVMTFYQAENETFYPFDLTKIWPHQKYPLHLVGRLVLDRNPTDYFVEIEQLAFAPSHLIPGIEPSPDKMLQARLFSYPDTHRHRLGANYQSIPVNQALCTSTANYQRDGPMQMGNYGQGRPNYFPNSFLGPEPFPSVAWHSDTVTGQVQRVDTGEEDNVSQLRDFYFRTLDHNARHRLTNNIASHLCRAQHFIRQRVIDNCSLVDPSFGGAISEKVDQYVHTLGKAKSRTPTPASALNPARALSKPIERSSSIRRCPFGYSCKL